MTINDIRADFALLDDWEDRYRYVIELGRALPPFPEELRTDTNKVRGCASQVWLATERVAAPGNPQRKDRIKMQGTSDAHIVQGLIARWMYVSLYKMHQVALHGGVKVVLDTLGRLISRRTLPHIKLH